MDLRGDEYRTLPTLLEMLPLGVVIAGDAECTQFGTTPRRLGCSGGRVTAEDLPLLRACIDGGLPLRDVKLEIARADGSVLHASTTAPVTDEQGNVAGCVAVLVDTTAENNAPSRAVPRARCGFGRRQGARRKRLASLHDDFQQLISAAKLKAGIVRRLAGADEQFRGGAEQIEQLLEATITASRTDQRAEPPVLYDGGLIPGIKALTRSFQKHRGIKVYTQ